MKSGDVSTQATHIWNFGAPSADIVSDRVSKRDYVNTRAIPDDLSEIPVSILLHEGTQPPANVTLAKVLYQAFLLISGALILKRYVLPLLYVA